MARNGIIGACLLLALPFAQAAALAQTATPPSAWVPVPGNESYDAAKAAGDALGPDALSAIQLDLIWTGDLNTLPTGEFGKRTFDGIRAFQKRMKAGDTGILLPAQRTALKQYAAKAIERFGFTPLTERGVSIGYPAKILTTRTEGRNGPHFASAKGDVTLDVLNLPADKEDFEALFARLKTERPGRKVTYSLLKSDFLVVSGTNDGKSFYLRFIRTPTDSRGFALGWDPALSPAFDRFAIAIAASLKPQGDQAAPAAAPPKPPVPASIMAAPAKPSGPPVPLPAGAAPTPKKGPGVVVSRKGDILTYASLIAGCQAVTVAGAGTAFVIAGDTGNDIALVRLATPTGQPALVWRTTPVSTGDTMALLHAPTPVSATVTAIMGPGEDMRRMTLSSSGGGAIVDKDGALAGLAAADGSPIALKALFIGAFLRANSAVEPAQGGEPAKAVVSLTCSPGQ